MGVPRVKKAKHNRPDMGAVIESANQLNFAIMVRTLYMVYDFSTEQLDEFCESYIALLEEIADRRATVTEFVKDTKQLCGIDVAKLVKELNVTNRKER